MSQDMPDLCEKCQWVEPKHSPKCSKSRRQCDPVGAVEIAARLGVKRQTVDQWRQRDIGFPEPRWLVGGRPAWNYDEIEAWSKARSH